MIINWLKKFYGPVKRSEFNVLNKKMLNVRTDTPDYRDYDISSAPIIHITSDNSLRRYCPPVKNQGWLGSCCSHAYCNALEILWIKRNDPVSTSELFHYYMARKLEKTWPSDSGMQMRTGAKVLEKFGTCFEEQIPYDLKNFNITPSWVASVTARFFRIKHYYRCYNSKDISYALSKGFPVCIGIRVDKSFLHNKTGFVNRLEGKVLGGHAMCVVGNTGKSLYCLNSWGFNWGDRGYVTLTDTFVDDNLIDAWALEK